MPLGVETWLLRQNTSYYTQSGPVEHRTSHDCDPNGQEMEAESSEIQGHPKVSSEFKTLLSYMRSCLSVCVCVCLDIGSSLYDLLTRDFGEFQQNHHIKQKKLGSNLSLIKYSRIDSNRSLYYFIGV